MVHRNTEYKNKYYFPNKELSAKIWLENIKFRESQRAMNLADHYWDFQMTNGMCDCEDCLKSHTECDGKSTLKRDTKITPSNSKKNDVKSKPCSSCEAAVQTTSWIPSQQRESVERRNRHLIKKNIESSESKDEVVIVQKKDCSPLPPTDHSLPKKQQCRKYPSSAGTLEYNTLKKRLKDMDEVQSLFLPFGWNNDKKNIGDKKTFNVLAPPKEVHPTALLSMKRRHAQLEQLLAKSKGGNTKQKSASLISIPRINHSSVWVTEYCANYSKNAMASR